MNRVKIRRVLRRWVGIKLRVAGLLLLVVVTVMVVLAQQSRSMSPLELWHRTVLDGEFTQGHRYDVRTLEAYLEIEDRLFLQLQERVVSQVELTPEERFNRYAPNSLSDPAQMPVNLNRTQVLVPEGGVDAAVGGALLIHGLTDSPYSLGHVAQRLVQQGYYVVNMRMPGHGTTPGSLGRVSRQDWLAAVRVGARHMVHTLAEPGRSNGWPQRRRPWVMVGYSNGGALVLNHVIRQADRAGQWMPDRVFLISPAVGVSRLAKVSDAHQLLSWMPWFKQYAWHRISPEYDPFKYTSFPKNAGKQISNLTQGMRDEMARLCQDNKAELLPKVVAFQSAIDSTVNLDKTLAFFDRLSFGASELVLFDVNRASYLRHFVATDSVTRVQALMQRDDLPYRLTVLTNASNESLEVVARHRGPGLIAQADTPLGILWPQDVYSLSHVALPMPARDPLYGLKRVAGENAQGWPNLALGATALRGERDLLTIPSSDLLRLRYNPFYMYLEDRLVESLPEPVRIESKGHPPVGGR